MKAKKRSAAQVREDCLVYDKPVTLQIQVPETGEWQDVQHVHANVNKAVSAQNFNADDDRLRTRLLFRIRYFSALETVRADPQNYRLEYCGEHFEITDYDDFNERRRVIKLTCERFELPVTVWIFKPAFETVLGVRKKVYPQNGTEMQCRWVTKPSVESKVNGVTSVTDHAEITLRMIPEITADCRIQRSDGTLWEIIGTPENTGLSDRWQVFTVRRIGGGA